ncbi:hypothetical protein ADJ70_11065 [Olsenella sp. oral taxon 807]|uniref:hypothetical protein n=1 Tax=Olsenella sp. oral taxon 807 TaxID=712411 RepID=UPI00067A02C4|nr:hypothetical protein [Olsenella sp. oral taxon 807]AKT49359.1 hypothetical protein ADJ70_11065 [Olsenella sp. oral taxon 807]
MGRPVLRVARPDDAQALVGIYAYYVEKTAVSFEWKPPSELSSKTLAAAGVGKTLELGST